MGDCIRYMCNTLVLLSMISFGVFLVWRLPADAVISNAVMQLLSTIVGGTFGYLTGAYTIKKKD